MFPSSEPVCLLKFHIIKNTHNTDTLLHQRERERELRMATGVCMLATKQSLEQLLRSTKLIQLRSLSKGKNSIKLFKLEIALIWRAQFRSPISVITVQSDQTSVYQQTILDFVNRNSLEFQIFQFVCQVLFDWLEKNLEQQSTVRILKLISLDYVQFCELVGRQISQFNEPKPQIRTICRVSSLR